MKRVENEVLLYVCDCTGECGPFSESELEELFLVQRRFSPDAMVKFDEGEVPIAEFFELSDEDLALYKFDGNVLHHGEMVMNEGRDIPFLQVAYLLTSLLFLATFFCLGVSPVLSLIFGGGSLFSMCFLAVALFQYDSHDREEKALEQQHEIIEQERDSWPCSPEDTEL